MRRFFFYFLVFVFIFKFEPSTFSKGESSHLQQCKCKKWEIKYDKQHLKVKCCGKEIGTLEKEFPKGLSDKWDIDTSKCSGKSILECKDIYLIDKKNKSQYRCTIKKQSKCNYKLICKNKVNNKKHSLELENKCATETLPKKCRNMCKTSIPYNKICLPLKWKKELEKEEIKLISSEETEKEDDLFCWSGDMQLKKYIQPKKTRDKFKNEFIPEFNRLIQRMIQELKNNDSSLKRENIERRVHALKEEILKESEKTKNIGSLVGRNIDLVVSERNVRPITEVVLNFYNSNVCYKTKVKRFRKGSKDIFRFRVPSISLKSFSKDKIAFPQLPQIFFKISDNECYELKWYELNPDKNKFQISPKPQKFPLNFKLFGKLTENENFDYIRDSKNKLRFLLKNKDILSKEVIEVKPNSSVDLNKFFFSQVVYLQHPKKIQYQCPVSSKANLIFCPTDSYVVVLFQSNKRFFNKQKKFLTENFGDLRGIFDKIQSYIKEAERDKLIYFYFFEGKKKEKILVGQNLFGDWSGSENIPSKFYMYNPLTVKDLENLLKDFYSLNKRFKKKCQKCKFHLLIVCLPGSLTSGNLNLNYLNIKNIRILNLSRGNDLIINSQNKIIIKRISSWVEFEREFKNFLGGYRRKI